MASDDRHTLKSHFVHQLGYDLWANDRILAAVEALPEGEAKTEGLRLTSHLVRAGTRWLERILDGEAKTEDRPDTIEKMRERARANAEAWTALLQERTAADFVKDVEYVGADGEVFYTELRVVVAHVLNHGTHHRAQVVRHIRLAGFQPPETGLIAYDRELQAHDEEV